MIVDNKISFEDWNIDNNFQTDNVKKSNDTKAFIDDLIIRRTGDEKIEIIRPINEDNNNSNNNNNSRETTTFEEVNTLDEILSSTTKPNNKEIMDTNQDRLDFKREYSSDSNDEKMNLKKLKKI